eukprot:gene51067-68359_t
MASPTYSSAILWLVQHPLSVDSILYVFCLLLFSWAQTHWAQVWKSVFLWGNYISSGPFPPSYPRYFQCHRGVVQVYQGASALNLDAKGRMSIPARHRDALSVQSEGRVTLTKHPHGCLLLFPRPVWELHREQIAAWPMSARAWQRIFLGNASDVEMDSAGRILIAPELRGAVGLARD